MLIARIPFWQLRRHGVVEEAWLRDVLEPLGFDLGRAIAVREPEGEEALEFRQDAPV